MISEQVAFEYTYFKQDKSNGYENRPIRWISSKETRYAPITDFELYYLDDKLIMYNEKLDVSLPFDIYNQRDIAKFKVDHNTVQMIKNDLDKNKVLQDSITNSGYDMKYCVSYNGIILSAYDTLEEAESFCNEPDNDGFRYLLHFPKNN